MEGVTDSANFNLLDELARLVAAKLSQGDPGPLASKQWVARSSRARDAMKLFSFSKAVSPPFSRSSVKIYHKPSAVNKAAKPRRFYLW